MTEVGLNQSGIYAITSPSGKRYIGSAVNIRRRWREHRSALIRGIHHCKPLQRAYVKYAGDFEWSVLVLCPKEELVREEQQQIDWAAKGTLYNANPVAATMLGFRHTQETRDKLSAAHKGKVLGKYSLEHRAKISASLVGIVRGEMRPEHREAIGRANRGLKHKNNTSGYVGVSKKRNKWRALYRINGRSICVGCYATAELAHQARQRFDAILRYYDDEY